jgi:hypothetical protein
MTFAITVEELPELLAMHRIIRRVQIERQFCRHALLRSQADERNDQRLLKSGNAGDDLFFTDCLQTLQPA